MADPWFWLLAVPAVILLGLAKGGFIGVGNLSMPMLALVIPPLQAAAVVLPILIVQDAVSVWSFRKSWDRHVLAVLLPSAATGVGLGYLFAASLSERWVLGALGLISLVFATHRLWLERGGREVAAQKLPDWVGILCGAGAGLTSQIAHAGGPPFQIWVLPRRLPRDVLVGTTAIFFAAINWIKVPAYVALGQFSATTLLTTAALLPIAIVSTFAGVRLVRNVPAERFYTIVYVLTALLGVMLLWDALA